MTYNILGFQKKSSGYPQKNHRGFSQPIPGFHQPNRGYSPMDPIKISQDVDIPNYRGDTAAALARVGGHSDLLPLLDTFAV